MEEDTNTASEEYQMPSLEAMLAGTLALMTGFAEAVNPQQRTLMSQKIFCNLGVLSQHPLVSPGFQAMVWNLRLHWLAQGSDTAKHTQTAGEEPRSATELARALWHTTPEKLQ